MTRILDDPLDFARDALDGLVAANGRHLTQVDGGVVRRTRIAAGRVAVVIGGGAGHYPAFAGLVGAGLATGSACGNIFASPAVSQICRVAQAAEAGGGVLLSYGNYAGDVLNFGQAQDRLRADGIDVRTVVCTDDIASAPADRMELRRGVAGDFVVFKIAGAAAEAGLSLDQVERCARLANARTRSLGIAFDGCTLPGADAPLFEVQSGLMAVGLGIHGEPGISEQPLGTASELAELLVGRLLDERPAGADGRVVPILNGLGAVTHEELFVLFGKIARLLAAAGLEVLEPECGQLVTSLDMAGVSLTLLWPDDELAELWSAPADSPAYRKGAMTASSTAGAPQATPEPRTRSAANDDRDRPRPTDASLLAAATAVELVAAAAATINDQSDYLGRLDAFAGDGDHGVGMARGVNAALEAARDSLAQGLGVDGLLAAAAEEWSERAGGTSGALWGAAIRAAGSNLGNQNSYDTVAVVAASRAALSAIVELGKAQVGDKTMVDAMVPFVERLGAGSAGESLLDALAAAAAAASDAAERTAELVPRLGRARPLAEKSVGHPDAGAVSFAMIVTQLAATAHSLAQGRIEERA
jgi:dihydroxyacetone kinase